MVGKYPEHIKGIKYKLSDGTVVKRSHNAEKQQREIYRKQAKFTAAYKECSQIGPEDFESSIQTKQLSPDTTIRELQQWYAEKTRGGRMNITINEEWPIEYETE